MARIKVFAHHDLVGAAVLALFAVSSQAVYLAVGAALAYGTGLRP